MPFGLGGGIRLSYIRGTANAEAGRACGESWRTAPRPI
jgi:hypothetical protein